MIWKRLPLIALPFLFTFVIQGQNPPNPNDPGPATEEAARSVYSVTGKVKRPKSYPLDKPTRVFDAINDAGGFLDASADKKDILIIRAGYRYHFNYDDYIKGKNKDSNRNIELMDGDEVHVD